MAHTSGFDLAPGDLWNDRYEIVRPLSVGGMGAVYEAVHVETRRRRALKLMRPELLGDAGARARFKLEAQVAAEIESEHIVEVVDAGVDARTGAPFLVMELLRGEDLGAALAKRGRLPPGEVVELLAQAARALDRTHAAGIVHRDLKPENLFVTAREDGTKRVKVLDFGIAKVLEESRHHTHATASIGTPVFMAPEQISGARIGPAADVYALGQIAFALLCGSAYWDVEAAEVNLYSLLLRVSAGAREGAVARAARYGVTLPAAVDDWFARATALIPEERHESAGDLVVALARAVGVPEPVLPRPVRSSLVSVSASGLGSGGSGAGGPTGYGATVPLGPAPKRRRWSLFAVAGAVVFVGIGAAAARLLGAAATGTEGPSAGASLAAPPPRVEPAPQGALPAANDPAASGQATATATATVAAMATATATARASAPATAAATAKAAAPRSTGSAAPKGTEPASNPLLTR